MTDPQPPRGPDEPTPVEPTPPIEPTPIEPTPIEPSPVEPTPIEPTPPSEPTPIEPSPVEPSPVPPVPLEPTPAAPAEPASEVRPTPAGEPSIPSDVPPPAAAGTPEAAPAYESAAEVAPLEPTPAVAAGEAPVAIEPPFEEPPSQAPVDPAPVDPAPVDPVPAPPDAPLPPQPRRSRAWVPAAALGLAVTLLAGATGFLAWQLWQQKQAEDGRPDAVAAARDAARLLFSYSHETLEADFAKGLAVTTGDFRGEYSRTTKEVVTPVAKQYDAVVVAEVVEASVIDGDSGEVTALVFLNQGTTSTRVEGQQVDQSRVRMHLVERDGEWLVEAVEAL